MIKFVHTADTHFGVENYGTVDPKTGLHTRLLDFYQNFNEIVDFCIEKSVDFIVIAGDAYKTPNPTPTQQKLFTLCLMRLYKNKISVVITVGNHDNPLSFGKAHALDIFSALPIDGFYVFSKPGILRLETKNGPIQILGIPWPTRHNILTMENYRYVSIDKVSELVSSKVVAAIKDFSKKLDRTVPSILVGHLTLSSGVFSGSEKTALIGNDPIFMPSDLAIEPFCYVGLGHLHRHQSFYHGKTPIVYSGSIEAIDFGEKGDKKGFCFVSVESKNGNFGPESICQYEFIPLQTRKMLDLTIELSSGLVQTEEILRFLSSQPINGSIVKLSYCLKTGVADCVDHLLVHQALSSASHILKIRPIYTSQERSARFSSAQSLSEFDLLQKYFLDRGISNKAEVLFEKANKVKELTCCQEEKKQEESSLSGGLG